MLADRKLVAQCVEMRRWSTHVSSSLRIMHRLWRLASPNVVRLGQGQIEDGWKDGNERRNALLDPRFWFSRQPER
jgi:hypothetical protein